MPSVPTQQIRVHGILGIIWGCLFSTSVIFSIASLSRLSNHHHSDKTQLNRYRHRDPLLSTHHSDRGKYYVTLLTAIIGAATSFLAIDVDRDPVPGLAFKLQCVFYCILQPLVLGAAFEAVRFWSWGLTRTTATTGDCARGDGEDEDGVIVVNRGITGGRGGGGVFMVLFYVLDAAGLLLCVVRDWDGVVKQDYEAGDVEREGARDAVLDGRFRAGQFVMLLCLVGIIIKLGQGWSRYRKLDRGGAKRRSLTGLALMSAATLFCGLAVGYNLISSFIWAVSPYNLAVSQSYYYGYGITPVWVTLVVINITGFTVQGNGSTTKRHQSRAGVRKPTWWNNTSRVSTSGDDTSLLDFNLLKHVRGREEKYESQSSYWWWQGDGDDNMIQDDNKPSNHEQQPGRFQLDVAPPPQNHDQVREPYQGNAKDNALGNSSPSSSRQRPQQRPVKSMLEI